MKVTLSIVLSLSATVAPFSVQQPRLSLSAVRSVVSRRSSTLPVVYSATVYVVALCYAVSHCGWLLSFVS
jgi:hypothetical protein